MPVFLNYTLANKQSGGVAQLGEHLICIQRVAGSTPVISTKKMLLAKKNVAFEFLML